MKENERITNAFVSFIYGDILAVNERNKSLKEKIKVGSKQYSYASELFLILSKSLVDNKKLYEVIVDNNRLCAELDLWKYYITEKASNISNRINIGVNYYNNQEYWDCKIGSGFSSVILFALANKNYSVAQRAAYGQILIFNRHPQVVIAGLLLVRTTHLLLENSEITQLELSERLKDFLIHLQLSDLENEFLSELPNSYRVSFEREKISFILEIGSIHHNNLTEKKIMTGKNKFLEAIYFYWELVENGEIHVDYVDSEASLEISAIAHTLYALNNKLTFEEAHENINWKFVKEMSAYINKLRHFHVGKKRYIPCKQNIDLFSLQVGDRVKHRLLNLCKIVEKRVVKHEGETETLITVECKSGMYELKQ
ncbi:MAG: hypothetical protein COA82_02630 [Alkaliphilus sp.]|nr:hypothetical protein [bacterium AH-315-L21]MBN4069319.1 hypothetical protein [bacterium AH-315-G05]PHS35936.1 MAG: hypothetical protein COA82_02630 [Alkaliphilus sp.]